MYKRKGKLLKNEEADELIIINEEDKSFQISHIGAFIWNKLDGETETEKISKELTNVGDIDLGRSKDITKEALTKMVQYDLAMQV